MLGVNEKRYQRGYDSRAGQLMRQPRNFTTIVTDQSNKSTRPVQIQPALSSFSPHHLQHGSLTISGQRSFIF